MVGLTLCPKLPIGMQEGFSCIMTMHIPQQAATQDAPLTLLASSSKCSLADFPDDVLNDLLSRVHSVKSVSLLLMASPAMRDRVASCPTLALVHWSPGYKMPPMHFP